MDLSAKKCCTDGFNSLPDELISQILSLLPTKDAAVVSLSSKKMRRAFMYLTTLDFDDSPKSSISYFDRQNAQLIERFQRFKNFVNNVLRRSQSPYLSKFILGFGGDMKIWSRHFYPWSRACCKNYFPNLEASMLNAWIRFALSRCGIREIDLHILVGEPGKLPCELFTCETLEVLKLDTNLDFDLVSGMSSFKLPNLKVLQLCSMIIQEDDFASRLVSNCPSLQELYIDCRWEYGKSVVISSPLLQKLVLLMNKDFESDYQRELLSIDTPNLQYFEYDDMLALCNSVSSMKALVQASISIDCDWGTSEECFREMLNVVLAVCYVQHLNVTSSFLEFLDYEDLKKQMPTFHNLKHLEMDTSLRSNWDDTDLFEFLSHSPVLEVLEFPEGIDPWTVLLQALPEMSDSEYHRMIDELEPWYSGKNLVSPYCCMPLLKRIVAKKYCGTMREVKLLRYLLEITPALEELLIICDRKRDDVIRRHYVNPALAESTLKTLPMASSICLLIVQ